MLKPEISMEVIKFMIENTNNSFELSFIETLSVENQEYVNINRMERDREGRDKNLSENY